DASRRHEQNVREKNRQLEREIAERKQAEDKLRESEDRYRTLVETSPDVIFTVSFGDGVFRSINPAFEKITGWPRTEWIGRSFLDIIHPDDHALVLEKHREAINGAGAMRYDLRCLTRSGKYRITEVTTAPILRNGAVSGRLGIARDITERTVLEEQLRHGVKMQAIGQLAGGIAHDFNNILSVIIGACDLVLMDLQEGSPQRRKIQMVLTSAERGAQLTRNLLTFSRKQVVMMQERNLNEIVLSIEPLIAGLIREDVRFSVDLTADRLLCMVDSVQVEQVLMNLAANARDAMTGGGRFTIASGQVTMDGEFRRERGFGREGRYAVLRVEDTGSGMDEKTRVRIFEPFFTTKDVGKGTGLGLATVFGIVKQHNGYIEVKSEIGRGTVFFIYLPLVADRADRAGAAPAPEHRLRGSETVLVAEDDESVRAVITQILAGSGYRVIAAYDGEDAETKFHDHRDEIDLLIFDVIMPRKNGKQAYDSIKKIRSDLKCLFLSGYAADIINNSGISEQEGAFLQKPVPPHLLLTKVREILGALPIQ
ncbi:MAG TPA: PAS domain S-box protein, partial [Nitrospirota bacterium]|nr:PAS domain S-box protein [Nitrospirota bacterium]